MRSSLEWHEALGHPSSSKVKQALQDQGIQVADKQPECLACPMGKGQHCRHPLSTEEPTDVVGEFVHADVGYIDNKLETPYNYYILCKDEASEFVFIYFMRNKSEVAQCLAKLFIDFVSKSDQKIKTIVSERDWLPGALNRYTESIISKRLHQWLE